MFLTVYKIENDQNGKIYIGCSKDTKQRLDAHGLTTGKFWRWAIEKLKAEPIPGATDTDEPPTT